MTSPGGMSSVKRLKDFSQDFRPPQSANGPHATNTFSILELAEPGIDAQAGLLWRQRAGVMGRPSRIGKARFAARAPSGAGSSLPERSMAPPLVQYSRQ